MDIFQRDKGEEFYTFQVLGAENDVYFQKFAFHVRVNHVLGSLWCQLMVLPQYEEDMAFFRAMYQAAGPTSSHIAVMTHADYMSRSHGNILQTLKWQHILITDGPDCQRKFDGDTLHRLCSLGKDIVVHGRVVALSIDKPATDI
jgi:hypothetical protein